MKVNVIRMNETPNFTNKFFADFPFVSRVFGVYLYDPEERTCLCEAQPSVFLRLLRFDAEYANACHSEAGRSRSR